ncbi:MAG: hypothetical protein IK017_10525 [Paludibacteraceae bacterium]|nr:hypothetical protein [Paludibacteraceae bacterium]
MENELERSSSSVSEEVDQLAVNEEAKVTLLSMSKWMKFLSIMGFIGIIFIVFTAIFFMFGFGSLMQQMQQAGNPMYAFMGPAMGILYIVIALVCLYPVMKMYNSSRKLKLAVLSNDEQALTDGFQEMRKFWKFYGIIAIIYLVIIAISLLIGIFSLIAAAF